MAQMAAVDPRLRGVVEAFEDTTYGKWQKGEGIPILNDFAVEEIGNIQLGVWPRLGVPAAFVNLYALMEGARGMVVAEIPPGGSTEPQHHLFEQVILILEGQGTTEIWQEGDTKKHVFEWGQGSVFSPPLNTRYRLFNLGREPVRFLAVNDAPSMMNGFRDPNFIYSSTYAFRDRFNGEDQFFAEGQERTVRGTQNLWFTNFIPNALGAQLAPGEYKGAGNYRMQFEMSGNALIGHIHEWPVGRYHKAHYHPAGPVLMCLRSEGYVLLWPKELGIRPYETGHQDEVIEVKWKQTSLYAPPTDWFHQHFNTGREPARQIAIRNGSRVAGPGFGGLRPRGAVPAVFQDVNEGGALIE